MRGTIQGVRMGAAHDLTAGDDVQYVAVDPATAAQMFDLDMVSGSIATLTRERPCASAGWLATTAAKATSTANTVVRIALGYTRPRREIVTSCYFGCWVIRR